MGTPCISWTPNCHLGMKPLQVMIPAQMKALLPSQMTSVMSPSILLRKWRTKRRTKTLGGWQKATTQLMWKVSRPAGWKMKCRFQNVNLRRWKSERGVVHSPPSPHPSHVWCTLAVGLADEETVQLNLWVWSFHSPKEGWTLPVPQRCVPLVMMLINTSAKMITARSLIVAERRAWYLFTFVS